VTSFGCADETEMTVTTDAAAIVRRAYRAAEGNVMDVQGFIDLFADDGVFNAVGQESFRGDHLGDPVVSMGKLAPDVHRELYQVHVIGNVVAIELSIRGTFTGQFEPPAGVIRGNGAKLDSGTWRAEFECYVSSSIMLKQIGIQPDFASAVTSGVTGQHRRQAQADRHEKPRWPREGLNSVGIYELDSQKLRNCHTGK